MTKDAKKSNSPKAGAAPTGKPAQKDEKKAGPRGRKCRQASSRAWGAAASSATRRRSFPRASNRSREAAACGRRAKAKTSGRPHRDSDDPCPRSKRKSQQVRIAAGAGGRASARQRQMDADCVRRDRHDAARGIATLQPRRFNGPSRGCGSHWSARSWHSAWPLMRSLSLAVAYTGYVELNSLTDEDIATSSAIRRCWRIRIERTARADRAAIASRHGVSSQASPPSSCRAWKTGTATSTAWWTRSSPMSATIASDSRSSGRAAS